MKILNLPTLRGLGSATNSPARNQQLSPKYFGDSPTSSKRLIQRRNHQLNRITYAKALYSSNQPIRSDKFNISISNPLIETKIEHYTKKLNQTSGSIRNIMIEPKEWSRVQQSENSDLEASPRSIHSSKLTPKIDGVSLNQTPRSDQRPFKPFANFNKPVTLFDSKRLSQQKL